MDVHQLNAQLLAVPQGQVFKLQGQFVDETLVGNLFRSLDIPPNVDVEFQDVEFRGNHFFCQKDKGRLIFRDCRFLGLRVEFTRSRNGHLSFLGNNQFAFGMSLDKCVDLSLHIDSSATFSGPPVLGVSVRKCSGQISIRGINLPLTLQVRDSTLGRLEVEVPEIRHLELLKSSVDELHLRWDALRALRMRGTSLGNLDAHFASILKIPFAGLSPEGVDGKTLDELAAAYRAQGEMGKFVKLVSRSGSADMWLRRQKLEAQATHDKGQLSWLQRWRQHRGELSLRLYDGIVNRWFQCFYNVSSVLILQGVAVAFFALLFFVCRENVVTSQGQPIHDFTQALYFSGVTFLTIGYGDILPSGWLQLAALAEGFGGLLLGLLLAVVASRRYSG